MSSPEGSVSVAEQVRVAVAEARDRRLQRLDPQALQVLSVVPEWTGRLAGTVLGLGESRIDELVDRLEADDLATVLRTAAPATDPLIAASVVGILGDLVPSATLAKVVKSTCSISDLSIRSRGLVELAPAVPASMVASAVDAAAGVPGTNGARALATLLRRVPTADRPMVAERIASAIERAAPLDQAELLVGVAGDLEPARRNQLVEKALEAAHNASSETLRSTILIRLGPAVPEELTDQMAIAVDRIVDRDARASILAAISRSLPALVVRLTEHQAPADDPLAAISELWAAAIARVQLGDVRGATEKADQIDDAPTRGRLLALLLDDLPGPADVGDAISLATHAAESVSHQSDQVTRIVVQSKAAICLARLGERASASALVTDLHAERRGVGTSVRWINPLTSLARASVEVGDVAGGAEAASAALQLLLAEETVRTRVLGVASLLPLLSSGDAHRATTLAIAAVDALPDPRERASLLAALAPVVDRATLGSSVAHTLELVNATRPRVAFWITDDARRDVLDGALRQSRPVDLLGLTADVAARVEKALADGETAEPRLTLWVEIAKRVGTPSGVVDAARWLTTVVDRALASDDLTTVNAIAAVGATVAQVVGEPLSTAVRQIDRKVALVHRQENDRRHLTTFLARQEQIDAITRLLDGPDEQWALHFLGAGGAGKTMLLRYLTGELAPARNIVTARVDFDYLNPDYPGRRPGELLLALASELEAYAESGRAEDVVRELEENAVALHAQLAKQERAADQLATLATDEFGRLIRLFTELLGKISRAPGRDGPGTPTEGEERRIILILDTCEELAKLQPQGTVLPSVVATFRIVEAIQKEVRSLRVIFAGRRLLAQAGTDWHADKETGPGTGALLPESTTYLALHEVRGFDEREARTYLRSIRGITLDERTEARLFDASREVKSKIKIVWDEPPAIDPAQRVSPFDLAVNAELANAARSG